MLLMTARKAFPSLQLGPKSFTCTPSCLLTCVLILRILLFKLILSHNLGLDPLEQSLFGSNLPALLSFPADASLANRTVVIRAETIIMMTPKMKMILDEDADVTEGEDADDIEDEGADDIKDWNDDDNMEDEDVDNIDIDLLA